ncbi:YkvA family protein [Clostridiaceae bacterium M8S5]|nr:YkvA family protein [Clostridiaceae bacterium M8S5]
MRIFRVIAKIKIAFKYLFDSNVKFRKKILIFFGFLYLISPIDLLPDPVFGIGLIDDLVVLLAVIFSMKEKLNEYEAKLKYGDIKEAKQCKVIELLEYKEDEK